MKKSLTALVILLIFFTPSMLMSFGVELGSRGNNLQARRHHTGSNEAYFRIESVDCNDNVSFILFRMFNGCQFVSCYAEIDSEKCSYFQNNMDSGSTDYKGAIELTQEKKTVFSSEYLVANLSYYQETAPFTSFESLQVVERFCDRDESYIVVKNDDGRKYAMLMGNDSLDYPVGSCFYHEFMTLQTQIEGLPVICGIQLIRIPIPSLSGKYCIQVKSEKVIGKQQYWIVQDLWGNDYAIPSTGHKTPFKDQVDLSQSSYWEITYAKVTGKMLINSKLYPVLSLKNIVRMKDCRNNYQKGKGVPKVLRFNLTKGIYSDVEAFDQTERRWLILGDPIVLQSLVENGGCILAKGETFDSKEEYIKSVFYCHSWQPIDCFDVLGGALNEGVIKEISSQNDSQYEIQLTILNFATRKTEQYVITSKTFPMEPQNLKPEDCIRFSRMGKQIYYCEKVECSPEPVPPKKGNLKGYLFLNSIVIMRGEKTWYLSLKDCSNAEISLQYTGDNFPSDRKTGGSIFQKSGRCAFVGTNGKVLQWWETSDEPCCDTKSKGLFVKPIVTYVTLCKNEKAEFKIEVENVSKDKLVFDIIPKKDSNSFDMVKSVTLESFEKKTIVIEASVNRNEKINRFNAEFVMGNEVLKTHPFVAVAKNEQECKSCDLEFTPVFDQKKPLCEGEEGVFTLNIRNKLATETMTVNLEGSVKEDAFTFEPTELSILPWEIKPVIIRFKQPKRGSLYYADIKINATTNCDKSFEYSYRSKFKPLDVCKPCCDFEVQTPEISAQLCQNEEKIFKFKVSNKCAKEKISFNVKPVGNNMPVPIEPDKFELETGQSKEISVKVAHSKNEKEMNWQLDVLASCDMKKTVNFVTNLKPPEDCDPCFGFSASISDPNKTELCENEEGNILVLLENKNKNKAMDALIKVVIKSEKPETIEKNIKLQPLTKTSVVMVFKQPKKAGANNTLVDISVAYCGKIEAKQLKFPYKSDQICKPCCNFKATPEKTEFAKVKAGAKIKSSITIENLCDTPASYTITGTKDIVFSQTKFDLKGRKSQKITLTITVPKSNAKSLTLPITITSCGSSIKKTVNIKLAY